MATKLEDILRRKDKGKSSAPGILAKVFRGFLAELDINYDQINTLMTAWLADPTNKHERDAATQANARGNLRKDIERDDNTWKIFFRLLCLLRPKYIEIEFRLGFHNGTVVKQTIHRVLETFDDDSDNFQFKEGMGSLKDLYEDDVDIFEVKK